MQAWGGMRMDMRSQIRVQSQCSSLYQLWTFLGGLARRAFPLFSNQPLRKMSLAQESQIISTDRRIERNTGALRIWAFLTFHGEISGLLSWLHQRYPRSKRRTLFSFLFFFLWLFYSQPKKKAKKDKTRRGRSNPCSLAGASHVVLRVSSWAKLLGRILPRLRTSSAPLLPDSVLQCSPLVIGAYSLSLWPWWSACFSAS